MTGREKRSRGSWWAGEGMRQSMSIYQRFSGEKCKQFSWIGFPSKPEPQEAVKIELGRVGKGGGRRAEAYTCPVPDSSLLWSLEHGGIDFKVGRVCNALIMYWSFTAQCLWWGWRINLLFAVLKIQTAQLQKCHLKKGALGKEKQCLADVASIVCFPSAEGGKMRRSFNEKWKLVSNDCCYLCYVATFLTISSLCLCQQFQLSCNKWVSVHIADAFPTIELFLVLNDSPHCWNNAS